MSFKLERSQAALVLVDESVLTSDGGTRIDHNALDSLLEDVAELWSAQLRCTLVITGESTVGRIRLGKLHGVQRVRRNEVWGAAGRALLSGWIGAGLGERGLVTGSMHLTRSSFADRESYAAARDCRRGLEENDAVPIVWDNDWVREGSSGGFGDADQLMAMLAGQAGAQTAVVGLAEPPELEIGGERRRSARISLDELDGGLRSGNIRVKKPNRQRFEGILAAARLLSALGIPLTVSGLKESASLTRALSGDAEQLVVESEANGSGSDGVKRWLFTGAIPKGVIVVSPYAATQLADEADRSSLLAAGVVDTTGIYREDDVVAVEDESRRLLGYGVTRYGNQDVADLRGKQNVIVIHADHFFGAGLQGLTESDESREQGAAGAATSFVGAIKGGDRGAD